MMCPTCRSDNVRLVDTADYDSRLAVCMSCVLVFEPETRADPERQMCDNCAFRPGSAERSNPYGWWDIIEATIVNGLHPFHCHKGLPCAFDAERGSLHFQQPADGIAAMTPCAGWRSRKIAYEAGVHWSRL
ncbi:MAG: hypothetical protein Rhirs2KO_09860 [Rhizobiaceae bacterium]